MEQIDNNKIAMSILLQCAWVWEHCVSDGYEGMFKLNEVCQGLGSRGYKSKSGAMFFYLDNCKDWSAFGSPCYPVEGMTYNHETGEVTLKFGTFQCSYELRNVFEVARLFCKANAPSMGNKVRFVYLDDKRCTLLPEVKKQQATKVKSSPTKQQHQQPLTPAERLRQALLAMQMKKAA